MILLLGATLVTTLLFLASTTVLAQNGYTSYGNQNCHYNKYGQWVCGGRHNHNNQNCHYNKYGQWVC